MDLELEGQFIKTEAKKAIWKLGADKAPGLDEFPIRFFRTLWDLT